MRYFIYGYYGCGNFGDDLMLSALVDQIRRRDADALLTVKCRDSVAGLGPGVSFLEADKVMEAPGPRWRRGLRYLRRLLAGIRGHDYLVIGGGALFLDKGRMSRALLLLWCLVLRARLGRIRVAIIGVSFDLLAHPASLWLARSIFRAADFITVRDAFSHDYVRYFGRGDARLCADLCFAAPLVRAATIPRHSPRTGSAKMRIGICLVDYYALYEPDPDRRRLFLDRMAACLNENAAHADYVYLSLQEDQGLGDNRMHADLSLSVAFAGYRRIGSLDALRDAFAGLDAVLTMRYHLGLLAAALGLPVGVLYHELKLLSIGFMSGVTITDCRQILDATRDPVGRLVRGQDGTAEMQDLEALAKDAEGNFFWLSPQRSGT